jgi:tripartite-type tricarboxylate transporter receptor subunit TctC
MKFSTLAAFCFAGLATLVFDSVNRPAAASDPSFADKTITMTLGFAGGSGTDLYGRTIGRHLVGHLPGSPKLIVLNQPGAGGVLALNDWANKGETGGLSITTGHQSQIDPDSLKRANAKYDPRTFNFLGGVGSYSQGLYVNKAKADRLTDAANPVAMGIVGSTLRGGNYQALWGATFLGWNVKWVRGYQSTAEVIHAINRGEIDMGSFGSARDAEQLRQGDKVTILSQAGAFVNGKMVKSSWLGEAPLIADLVESKITDPQARQAFDYWQNIIQIGIWLALPPNTPDNIVATYNNAFAATIEDPAFKSEYSKINPDALFVAGSDVSMRVNNVVNVSPETLQYMDQLLQRQGFVTGGQ